MSLSIPSLLAVTSFRKKLHLRCLTGFWIRLWYLHLLRHFTGFFQSIEGWSETEDSSKWKILFFSEEHEWCFSQDGPKCYLSQDDQVLPKRYRGPVIMFFSFYCFYLIQIINITITSEIKTSIFVALTDFPKSSI